MHTSDACISHMGTTTVRLRPETRAALRQISEMTGETMQDALDKAIQERQRRLYLEGLNADYALLQEDAKASEQTRDEQALWDVTNDDGLD